MARPPAIAASTSAWPGGLIRPALVSAATLAMLTLLQRLLGLRGVYFCRKYVPSSALRWLEIHPQHRPTSTASSDVIEAIPEPFLAILIHTPSRRRPATPSGRPRCPCYRSAQRPADAMRGR
jgi:hypothetical protein